MSQQSEPPRPDGVADYILDGIDRQDEATLKTLQEYIQDRLAYLRTEPEPEELVDEDEKIVEIQDDPEYERPEDVPGKATLVKKKVPCGPGCDGCPHGPYIYWNWREGDSVRTEYGGKP